ncbi:MAG: permease [bacterium]|nr:permease [bacterium]
MLAGVISTAIPDDFFAGNLGGGIGAMLVMMLIGLPLYVCSTASVPIAAVLMTRGSRRKRRSCS